MAKRYSRLLASDSTHTAQGFAPLQRISDPDAATGVEANAGIDRYGRALITWYANNQVRMACHQ